MKIGVVINSNAHILKLKTLLAWLQEVQFFRESSSKCIAMGYAHIFINHRLSFLAEMTNKLELNCLKP